MIALPLAVPGIISTIGNFIRNNWRWILPALLVIGLYWYISNLQGERDAAIKSLAEYQQAVKSAAERRKAENLVKEEKAKLALDRVATDHQTEINRLRKRYESLHKTDQAAADRVADNWRDSLRNSIATHGLPGVPKATGQPAEGGRDCDAAAARYDTLEIACGVTTADYNALWKSWHDACQVYGCE